MHGFSLASFFATALPLLTIADPPGSIAEAVSRMWCMLVAGPVEEWLLLRFAVALFGGIAAVVVRNYSAPEGSKLGLCRAIPIVLVSWIAGLCLLKPGNTAAAFTAGFLGWYTAENLIAQRDGGKKGPKAKTAPKALTQKEVKKQFEEGN